MLKSAHLYKEKLMKAQYESWYDLNNQFWNCGCYDSEITLPENNYDTHTFVSVDSNDKVIGYIVYGVDQIALKACGFGIISFDKGNPLFAKDLYQCLLDIFYKYNLNKIEFMAYTDNPVIDAYRRFIKKVGGNSCGVTRQTSMLLDHKLHDSEAFEIMKSEFVPLRKISKQE